MEWINKIWTTLQQLFSEGPGYIKENPKSGYLVVILILLVWLTADTGLEMDLCPSRKLGRELLA